MGDKHIPPFYRRYMDLVNGGILVETLRENGKEMRQWVSTWTEDMAAYRYEETKWSAREVLIHITDAERVFAYRAMRFARKDKTALPGFDENFYALEYSSDHRTIPELLEDMEAVRQATVTLFRSFSPLQLKRTGTASGVMMSVRSIGEVIAGHELHHKNILLDRYFPL
jgi:hypothetical protein